MCPSFTFLQLELSMSFRVTVIGYNQDTSYLQVWCLGTRRYPAPASVTAAYPEGMHLNCTSYFGKWKFDGLGKFLPVNSGNQKAILTLSKTVEAHLNQWFEGRL